MVGGTVPMTMIWTLLFDRPIVVTMVEFCLPIHIELSVLGQFSLFTQQRVVRRGDHPDKGEPAGPEDGQCNDDHMGDSTRG